MLFPLALDSQVDPELSKVDLLVWLGDLNYRLVDLTQEEAKGLIGSRQWGTLLACDQLAGEMAQGRAFAFMREGPLLFPPTYKFDRGTTKPMGASLVSRAPSSRCLFPFPGSAVSCSLPPTRA